MNEALKLIEGNNAMILKEFEKRRIRIQEKVFIYKLEMDSAKGVNSERYLLNQIKYTRYRGLLDDVNFCIDDFQL